MKAAAYIRVSTREQAEGGVSLDVQEAACRKAARRLGDGSVELYRDGGYSGGSIDRPGLQELLANLPTFDALVVWRIDRLARKQRDYANIVYACGQSGCKFVSVTEGIDLNSAAGRATGSIMATMAELQTDIQGENIQAALDKIAHSGRWPSGPPPFGYGLNGDGLLPNAQDAEIVRNLYAWYLEGESLRSLCRKLNGEGIRTKHGSARWNTGSVRLILENPAYIGQLRWRGQTLPGNHEPIVNPLTWQAVQVQRSAVRRLMGRTAREPRTIVPLLRCAKCGGRIHTHTQTDAIYVDCAERALLPREDRHEGVCVRYDKLRFAIWGHLATVLSGNGSRFAAALKQHRRAAATPDRETPKLLAQVEQRIMDNIRLVHKGNLPIELFREVNDPLLAERERLQEKLQEPDSTGPPAPPLEDLSRPQEAIRHFLQVSTPRQELTALNEVLQEVSVTKRHLTLHYMADLHAPDTIDLPRRFSHQRAVEEWGEAALRGARR